MIKGRRDSRKSGGDPADVDGAKKIIAQQDADIDTLLKTIEQMKAKNDFSAAPSVEKGDADDKKDSKSKPMNADSVDAIVREQVSLLRLCDRLHLDGVDTMTIPQIKQAVIKAVKPILRLDGQSDTYIDAAFDFARQEIEAHKGTDYQRWQMFNTDAAGRKPQQPTGAFARRQQMIEDMGGKTE